MAAMWVVGKNSGYAVTCDTPKITLDRKFHPHIDANNSPSQDDNDSATNSSTSNTSFPEMKVLVKKAEKTFLVTEYKSNQKIPNAQAEAVATYYTGLYVSLVFTSLCSTVMFKEDLQYTIVLLVLKWYILYGTNVLTINKQNMINFLLPIIHFHHNF